MSDKQMTAIDQFSKELAGRQKRLESLLPDHIDAKKFMRLTVMAIQRNPDLLGKNRDTLFQSVHDCASDGLIPDGREAALVPFGNEVAYMPMVSGILKKIRQSGELKSIMANVIHEGEEYDYYIDEDGPHFYHKPSLTGESGKVIAVYASAITKDGGKYVEVMKVSEVEKVRAVSKVKNGPWSTWWEEMAKKTAIRRLAKRMPMSTDVEQVIQREDQFYDFDQQRDVSPEPQGSTADKVKAKLKEKTGNQEEEKPVATPPPAEEEDGQEEFPLY